MAKSVNKNFIAFVLFVAGITIGIVLVDETRSTELSNATISKMTADEQTNLCVHSSAIRSIANEHTHFKVTDVATTAIADRGLLCQVQGQMTRELSGGRYAEAKVQRLVLVSVRTGESEMISDDVYRYLQGSNVIKTLASNKAEKPANKLAAAH